MTESRIQRHRRYKKLYSETVLKLVGEKRQPPALVADLARQRVSAEWRSEFGPGVTEDWLPAPPQEN